MRVTEPQLRSLLLAQAIEQVDSGRTLVSPPELEDATRSAVASARERGVQRVGVGDVVLERAATIVQRASGRDTTVAALRQPAVRGRWLARGLPLAALLLGLAIDRIANAHRVDLLSPPLLAVLAAVRGVDAGAIARRLEDKSRIPAEVHAARVAAVKTLGLAADTDDTICDT